MKKSGYMIIIFLALLWAYAWNLNGQVGNPAEYISLQSAASGWKQEVKLLASGNDTKEYLSSLSVSETSAAEKYDDEFFSENVLIAAVITEPAGDVRHEILTLKEENGYILIRIKRTIPVTSSGTKATTVYLIEADRDFIAGCDNFVIKFI
ncbi:MAG: hypothetical protein E7218_07960 [Anaerofustis stercorihominis]|nr:hypothetical protein [Anaerofustis stercorihominis]